MLGNGAHGVVGDASWDGAVHPGWVGEERVEAPLAALERSGLVMVKGTDGGCEEWWWEEITSSRSM